MQVYGNNEMMTGSVRDSTPTSTWTWLTGGRLDRHRSVLANGIAVAVAVAVVPTAQQQYAIVHQRSLLRNHIKSGSVGVGVGGGIVSLPPSLFFSD